MFEIDDKQTLKFIKEKPLVLEVYKCLYKRQNKLFNIWSKVEGEFEYKPGWNIHEDGIRVFYFTGKILEDFLDCPDSKEYVRVKFIAHLNDLIGVGKYGDECLFSKIYLDS